MSWLHTEEIVWYDYPDDLKESIFFWFGFPSGNPNPTSDFVSDNDDHIPKCAVIGLVIAIVVFGSKLPSPNPLAYLILLDWQ